ncbi:hypothetical protein RJ640_029516 [Escallonia rubra]|uniref:Uncharacterized protein n=1 Tax=Escallonia rubra TaxID=112253 RepID=A0AA88S1X7_9ASTE|nr:hypothetical protein RJ640_029516 [Escallonia rubra]
METLEVLLAERRVDEALAALDEGGHIAEEANYRKTLTAFVELQTTTTEQRQKLADELVEAACQPSTSGIELRSAVQSLKQLSDGHRARTLLLQSHHQKLLCDIQRARPLGTSYRVAYMYTAALSKLVFNHCTGSKPCVELALTSNLKRIEQSTAALAAADDRSLTSTGWCTLTCVIASQQRLSSSGHRFNTMVQETFDDVGQLDSWQLANPASAGPLPTFTSHTTMLINAFPGSVETENLEAVGKRSVQIAETGAQQISLLANAPLSSGANGIEATASVIGLSSDMYIYIHPEAAKYLSQNLHRVITNMIGRAIEAVAATRLDTYSVLPEDDRFADVARNKAGVRRSQLGQCRMRCYKSHCINIGKICIISLISWKQLELIAELKVKAELQSHDPTFVSLQLKTNWQSHV